MNSIVYVAIIIGILAGLVYYGITTSSVKNEIKDVLTDSQELANEIISKSPAGDTISLIIPVQQSQEEKILQNMEQQKQDYNATNSTTPTLSGSDLSYSRQNTPLFNTSFEKNTLYVQQGNIAYIEGNIKIINPDTGKPYETGYFDYRLGIECAPTLTFCSTEPLGTRGVTDGNGHFFYKWVTDSNDKKGKYIVTVFAQSEHVDPKTQKKWELEQTMFIEVV